MKPSLQRMRSPMARTTVPLQHRSRFSFAQVIEAALQTDSPISCVADVHAILGEGPIWVQREAALYWVDIKGLRVFRLSENGDLSQWPTPFRIGSIAPRADGGFIAGTD